LHWAVALRAPTGEIIEQRNAWNKKLDTPHLPRCDMPVSPDEGHNFAPQRVKPAMQKPAMQKVGHAPTACRCLTRMRKTFASAANPKTSAPKAGGFGRSRQ
jgi:hypothetical protein